VSGDLFPYVYMRIWPDPPAELVALEFVAYPYPLNEPPTGEYLQQMVQLRASGEKDAREKMEQLSVDYIEGKSFVSDPKKLEGPVASYPAILRFVLHPGDESAEEIIAEVFRLLGLTPEETRVYLASAEYTTLIVRVWQSYFALVVELGYDVLLRDELVKLLVVDHLLRWLVDTRASAPTRQELDKLARASITLPKEIFPLPPTGGEVSKPPDEESWIFPYAIGDLQMVRHKLVGYALGELAFVESVMPGERRKSVRRKASRLTQVSSRTVTDDDARSTQAQSRSNSLKSEVSSTIGDTIANTTYNNFQTSYGPPTTATLNGSWSIETKPVEDGSAHRNVTRFAKDVLEKAKERIAHKVVEARTTTASRESEETTISILDNTAFEHGRHGIYRWLNEVFCAYVVNYGNRLMLEMMIPKPGAHFLAESEELPRALPPVPPSALGIVSFMDVTPENFPELAARYPSGELRLPPAAQRTKSGPARSGELLTLTLPEGYVAEKATVGYVLPLEETSIEISGLVGQTKVQVHATETGTTTVDMQKEDGAVQVLLHTTGPLATPPVNLEPLQLTVEIESTPSEHAMDAWRFETFRAIQRAFAVEQRAYSQTPVTDGASDPTPRPRPSYRAIERREIKRGAIELLFERARARLGPGSLVVARPRYLQFFEKAFEWAEMSYGLIMDAGKGAGAKAHGIGDNRFLDFLEAAYARALVPVEPREAMAVLYFLASGMIWNGRARFVAVHEADIPLTSELKKLPEDKEEPRVVSEPWEVVVPTTISVLADGSESLDSLLSLELCGKKV